MDAASNPAKKFEPEKLDLMKNTDINTSHLIDTSESHEPCLARFHLRCYII